jgi:ketosteroid isomerase-like protein
MGKAYGWFTLVVLLSGCGREAADSSAEAQSAVREADAQWSRTAGANDLDGTVAYYAEDASLLPPNAPIATGSQAIRAVWAELLNPDTTVSWQVTRAEAARSGELAYVMGVYQIAAKNPKGKPQEDRGKLVEIWKKQAGGRWKVVADIFNSDVATPAPPGKK